MSQTRSANSPAMDLLQSGKATVKRTAKRSGRGGLDGKTSAPEGKADDLKRTFSDNLTRLLCQQKLTAAQFVKTVFHDDPVKRKWFLRLLREGVSRVHRGTEADLQALADRLGVSLTDLWNKNIGLQWEDRRHPYWRWAEKLLELLDDKNHRWLFQMIDDLHSLPSNSASGVEPDVFDEPSRPSKRGRSEPPLRQKVRR